ncbi:MAG: hypothetical protein AAB074_03255 [Planctomycetota bacterium]
MPVDGCAGPAQVRDQLFRERIRRVFREEGRRRTVQRRWLGRAASRERFDRLKGMGMKPRSVAGELELVRGVAEKGVSENVGVFGVQRSQFTGVAAFFWLMNRISNQFLHRTVSLLKLSQSELDSE